MNTKMSFKDLNQIVDPKILHEQAWRSGVQMTIFPVEVGRDEVLVEE